VSDVDPAVLAQREYIQALQVQMADHGRYFRRQLRRHRLLRMIVIIAGISVPVLSAWPVVPREFIAAAGAVAAVAEGWAQLFAYQETATHAQSTANQLERELNRFLFSAGPYAGGRDFAAFVDRIEQIRDAGDNAFTKTWQRMVASGNKSEVEGGGVSGSSA
jgi:uncharacterized protein DUF4231